MKYPLKLSIFFILLGYNLLAFDKNLYWMMVNVNSTGKQGDAHILSKHGKLFMIDTGQKYYVATTLLPFLRQKHFMHFNGILITHPHFDHYGGLKYLIEHHIKIDAIYMNLPTKEQMEREWWGGKYSDLISIIESAKKHHIPIYPVKQGDMFRFDDETYIKVLYAYDGIHTPVGRTDINDMSVIAMLFDRGNRFLFTGDLNKKLGGWIAKHATDIHADILKFPHHGTEGFAPDNFFKTVDPQVVLVPGPKGLWCSKRSKRARKLVRENNYHAYINGFHGNVTVVSDGKKFNILTENKISDIQLCKEK